MRRAFTALSLVAALALLASGWFVWPTPYEHEDGVLDVGLGAPGSHEIPFRVRRNRLTERAELSFDGGPWTTLPRTP
jgi:hypothetical protein